MKLKDLNKNLAKGNLCLLGEKYKTDKFNHGYTKVYYEVMKDFRNEYVDIFEIGIFFGASIKMWEEFFPNGRIYGIDNGRIVPGTTAIPGGYRGTGLNILSQDDVKLLQPEELVESVHFKWIENERIKCFKADQRSYTHLKNAMKYFNCDMFDIILDDGQHFQEHQQKSLGLLFPHIKSGRYYIIEDVVDYETLIKRDDQPFLFWGQKRKDATDSTDYVFSQFIKTGKLNSPYINKEQVEYIISNIEDIYLYDRLNRDNSPIDGSSKLLIIKKK